MKFRLSATRLGRTFGWSGSRQEWTMLIGFIAWLLIGAGVWRMMRMASVGESVAFALGWLLVLLVAAWPVVRGLFGPVFYYELIRTGRQRSTIVFRCLYAAIVGCVLTMMYTGWIDDGKITTIGTSELAKFGIAFFHTFVTIQYVVVVLLTPVYVGGAIAIEKERKTLEFLLATDLRNREILFGKLIVRVMWLLTFVLAGLPLLALVQLFGGVDPEQLIASFAATVVTVVGLSAVAIWMSTMMRKARDAILLTFVGYIAYLFASFMLMVLAINLTRGAAPYWNETAEILGWKISLVDIFGSFAAGNIGWNVILPDVGPRVGLPSNPAVLLREFTLFWLFVGSLCLGHAILRLRAVTLNQSYGPQGSTKSKTRKLKTNAGKSETAVVNESTKEYPEIGDNPMLWREVFVEGHSRSGCIARIIFLIIGALIFVPLGIIIWEHLIYQPSWRGNTDFSQRWHEFSQSINRWVRMVSGIISMLMFFAISMRAAGAISGERDKDSWISLISTPLSADEILWGKWWGTVLGMRRIYLVFAIVWSIGLAVGGVRPEMLPLMILSLALYVSAFSWIGLYCSMTARNTMIASVRAFFATIFFVGAFWVLIFPCSLIPISLFRVAGNPNSMEATVNFFYSLTPSFMVGWLPLFEFGNRELAPFDETKNSHWLLPGLGMTIWLAFNIVAFLACQARFRRLRQSE